MGYTQRDTYKVTLLSASGTFTMPSGIVSGDKMIVHVMGRLSSATVTAALGGTGSGIWTESGQGGEGPVNGVIHYGIWEFSKDSNGNNDAPTLTLASGETAVVIAHAYLGLSFGAVGSPQNTVTVNGNTLTPTVSGVGSRSRIFTPCGALANGAVPSLVFGGGDSQLVGFSRSSTASAWGALGGQDVVGTGVVSPTAALSSSGTTGFRSFSSAWTIAPDVMSPTGIASAEAVGTPTVSTTVTASPSGIASAEAVGTPAISTTVTASSSGVASAEAFGSPTLTPTITASPTGTATGETLGTPTVTPGAIAASPGGISTGEALGTPTIAYNTTLSPTGIASAESLGAAAIAASVTVSPTAVASGEALGTAAVTDGTLTSTPTGVASAEAFGAPSVSSVLNVAPDPIDTGEAFGAPTVNYLIVVEPASISTAELLGNPTVTTTLTVTPDGIASDEQFGEPSVDDGSLSAAPDGIPTAETLGIVAITVGTLTVTPDGIPTGESFGTATATIVAHPRDITVHITLAPRDRFHAALATRPIHATLTPRARYAAHLEEKP